MPSRITHIFGRRDMLQGDDSALMLGHVSRHWVWSGLVTIYAKTLLLAGLVVTEASIAVAQNSDAPPRRDPDRLICQRIPETGSLVKARRQCFTKQQWDRIAESQRNGASRMIDDLATRPTGQ